MNFDYPWMPSNVNDHEFNLLTQHSQLLENKNPKVGFCSDSLNIENNSKNDLEQLFQAGLLPSKLVSSETEPSVFGSNLFGALTHVSVIHKRKNKSQNEDSFVRLNLPELPLASGVPNLIQAHQTHALSRNPELQSLKLVKTSSQEDSLALNSLPEQIPTALKRFPLKNGKTQSLNYLNKLSDNLFNSTITMLTGGDSYFFLFDAESLRFKIQTVKLKDLDLDTSGIIDMLERLADIGTNYKILSLISQQYINNPYIYGLIGKSFGLALKEYLDLAYSVVLMTSEKARASQPCSFLFLKRRLQTTAQNLSLLIYLFKVSNKDLPQKNINSCFLTGFQLPIKVYLLDSLDLFIKKLPHSTLSNSVYIIYAIFIRSTQPYLIWLRKKLLLSTECSLTQKIDPYLEFLDLEQKDYPTSLFSQSIVHLIMQATKALCVLADHFPAHALLRKFPSQQFLDITLSQSIQKTNFEALQFHQSKLKQLMNENIDEKNLDLNNTLSILKPTCLFDAETYSIENTLDPLFDLPLPKENATCALLKEIQLYDIYIPNIQTVVEDSLHKTIYSQCRFIVCVTHNSIVQDKSILDHFRFIESFFFLGYGPFVQSIQHIFSEAIGGTQPAAVISKLNFALTDCIGQYKRGNVLPPGSESITFTYDELSTDIDFFDRICLTYTPSSPANIFFTPDSFILYGKAFHILSRLLAFRCLLVLQKNYSRSNRLEILARLQSLHFVTSLQNALLNTIIYPYLKTVRNHLSLDPWSMQHPGIDFAILAVQPTEFIHGFFLSPELVHIRENMFHVLDTMLPFVLDKKVNENYFRSFDKRLKEFVNSLKMQTEIHSSHSNNESYTSCISQLFQYFD